MSAANNRAVFLRWAREARAVLGFVFWVPGWGNPQFAIRDPQ